MRTGLILAAVVLAASVAACGEDPPGGTTAPGGSPTASPPAVSSSPSVSPSPTPPPTDPAIVFAADGIGAYVIGTTQSDLQARGLITDVEESLLCDTVFIAKGTGRYATTITLTFRSGRLSAVHTASDTLITPSGARVGLPLADIQGIYGARGTLINGSAGNKAFSVRVPASALAIVFYLDETNTRVKSMSGGEAQALEDAARVGEGC
jgi:hypothetical protein